MKQGKEDFKIIKEEKNKTGNYIFQKSKLTKIIFLIIVIVLVVNFIVFLITSAKLD